MIFLIPIKMHGPHRQDTVPLANAVIIAANVLLFWLSDSLWVGGDTGVFSVLTYAFAHANVFHLLGNMWVLWVFGNSLNRRIGHGWYVALYLGTAVFLGLFARVLLGDGHYLVGASGCIFAVVALALVLMPSDLIEVFLAAIFPITLLVGLVAKPAHWVFWFVRWQSFKVRAWWGLIVVPLMELWGLIWSGWNWTNLGHLLGLLCGVAFALLLPQRISMNRHAALGTT